MKRAEQNIILYRPRLYRHNILYKPTLIPKCMQVTLIVFFYKSPVVVTFLASLLGSHACGSGIRILLYPTNDAMLL